MSEPVNEVVSGAAPAEARGARVAVKGAVVKGVQTASKRSTWIGVYGLFFGMGEADKRVSATVVRNDFHRFARGATFLTAILSVGVVAILTTASESARRSVWIGMAIYAVVLAAALIVVALKQKKHDRIHGRVKAEFEITDLKPATPEEFKKAISGMSLGTWAWLLLSAYKETDFPTLGVAALVMFSLTALRRHQSKRATTIPAQMKFQAVNIGLHVALSVTIFLAAGWLGQSTQILGRPNWQPCIPVLIMGITSVVTTWRAANKFERQQSGAAA